MVSVARLVRQKLLEKWLLSEAIDEHLVNGTALARYIYPEIAASMREKPSQDAVAAAVKRALRQTKRSALVHHVALLDNCKIALRTHLYEIHLRYSRGTLDILLGFARAIDWATGEKMLFVVRGTEILVMAEQQYAEELMKLLPAGKLLRVNKDAALIDLAHNPDIFFTGYGGLHFVTGLFAGAGVPVLAMLTTYSNTSFLVNGSDAPAAFRRVGEMLTKLQKKG